MRQKDVRAPPGLLGRERSRLVRVGGTTNLTSQALAGTIFPMTAPFVVLHIPHSSTVIPAHVRPSLCLPDKDLARETLLMTDQCTDELFDCQAESVTRVVFPVSRLVLDPERFTDDAKEPMAKKGMGVVYTKTSDGKPLRRPGFVPTRAELIEEFYRPHHNKLEIAVAESLRDNGSCLILDCHSFPSVPLPYESCSGKTRPGICLGTVPSHTPEWFIQEAERLFRVKGFSVAQNDPFEGVLVPDRYQGNASVLALMIEINRSLYMDEASGDRLPGFPGFKGLLLRLLEDLIDFVLKQLRMI